MLNVSIFSFIILNLSRKVFWTLQNTATDIWMKKQCEEGCLCRALLRKNMEAMKALILTIIELNLISEGLSLFTVLSYLWNSLQCKQFLFPFIDSSSRPEGFLKISQNQQENSSIGVSFYARRQA